MKYLRQITFAIDTLHYNQLLKQLSQNLPQLQSFNIILDVFEPDQSKLENLLEGFHLLSKNKIQNLKLSVKNYSINWKHRSLILEQLLKFQQLKVLDLILPEADNEEYMNQALVQLNKVSQDLKTIRVLKLQMQNTPFQDIQLINLVQNIAKMPKLKSLSLFFTNANRQDFEYKEVLKSKLYHICKSNKKKQKVYILL